MPRKKLSEYRAKSILNEALQKPLQAWEVTSGQKVDLDDTQLYVVKVDQAVKRRFKNGLVLLRASAGDVQVWIDTCRDKGYDSFIIEPYRDHAEGDERYLSVTRDQDGVTLTLNPRGGVNIEESKESLLRYAIDDDTNWDELADKAGVDIETIRTIVRVFHDTYATFLEINPYLTNEKEMIILDAAMEVDDAGSRYVSVWSDNDFRHPPRIYTEAERKVAELAENSPASFSLQSINEDGAIFLLLSGGGASVVVADEIFSAGYGHQLANYGEYSGNPTAEETYLYASAVLDMVINSKADEKIVFIGGAVANFTDIAKTFAGIIKAIDERADVLRDQHVKITVRRGGPHQKEGLKKMKDALEKYGVYGGVYGPDISIGAAVRNALEGISNNAA